MYIEAKTNRPTFRRRYFLMHFLQWRYMNLDWYFTAVCSWWLNQQHSSIGSDNSLTPTRRPAIIWTVDGMVAEAYASLCLNGVKAGLYNIDPRNAPIEVTQTPGDYLLNHKMWTKYENKLAIDNVYRNRNAIASAVASPLDHEDVIKWKHFPRYWPICAGNSPVPGECPTQRPLTRSIDVFFDLRLNKRLSQQSWGWWFEMLSRPLWRHRNLCRKLSVPIKQPQPSVSPAIGCRYVNLSVRAYAITVTLQERQTNNKENIKAPHCRFICDRNPLTLVTGGSPHKRLPIRKAFTCREGIMCHLILKSQYKRCATKDVPSILPDRCR